MFYRIISRCLIPVSVFHSLGVFVIFHSIPILSPPSPPLSFFPSLPVFLHPSSYPLHPCFSFHLVLPLLTIDLLVRFLPLVFKILSSLVILLFHFFIYFHPSYSYFPIPFLLLNINFIPFYPF